MYDQLRDTAIAAARTAGREALRRWSDPHDSRSKGPRDIVTEADLAAERVATELILSYYPNHAILAEEGGELAGDSCAPEYRWIIDPIDGTTNYARRLPIYTVSVAVAHKGRPVAGALYDPVRDQMYHATLGGGAFCDKQRLSCSTRRSLPGFLIAVDWPRSEEARTRMLRAILACSAQIGGWRSLGSAALGIAMVGAGIVDAYLHTTLHPWDMAAAGLMVEEAGGRVSGVDGSPHWWEGESCLASNGRAHDALLDLFRSITDDVDFR